MATKAAVSTEEKHWSNEPWGKNHVPHLKGKRVRLHIPGHRDEKTGEPKYEGHEGVIVEHEPNHPDTHGHWGDAIVTVQMTTGPAEGETLRLHNLPANFTVLDKKK